jgi:hypothetical protein
MRRMTYIHKDLNMFTKKNSLGYLLEAFSSICKLRTCHAIPMRDTLDRDITLGNL